MKRNLLENPPRTIMEVYKNLPEGTLAELIDNVLYMSPSPVYKHQQTLQTIFRQLSIKISDQGNGDVIIAPYDVYFDKSSNAVQPDIIVVLNENRHIIDPNGHIHGTPDLIIEILSAGNRDHDLIRKKDLYERFGVKEYWAVDPETKLALGYTLEQNRYKQTGEDIGLIRSSWLGVEIRL